MYEFEEQPDYHSFHPDTGRRFSHIPLVENFQRTSADFAVSALMFTLPVEADSSVKRAARRLAGTLLDFVSREPDVKKLPGVTVTDSGRSGVEPLSLRGWITVSVLGAAAAVALAVTVPEVVKDISEILDTSTVHFQEPDQESERTPYSTPIGTDPTDTYWLIQPGLEARQPGTYRP